MVWSRDCVRIPVNVIMEQSPVAWPLPFSDSSRDDHDRAPRRCCSSCSPETRLSTIRTDSIQVIRTGLGSIVINALFGLGSILIRSDDGADVRRSARGRLLSSCNLGFLKLWEALSVVDGETFCGDRRLLAYSVITVVACWTGCVDGRHTWSHLRSSATWKDGLCDGGKGGAGGREKLGRFRGTQGPAFVFCLCVLDCSVEFACVRACMDGVCVCVCVSVCVCLCVCVSVCMCLCLFVCLCRCTCVFCMYVREIRGWNNVKLCIKAAAYVQFFNFLLRLLIKCGFYSRADDMQCFESGTLGGSEKERKFLSFSLPPRHMYSESATLNCECNKIVWNVNKHFGMRKAVGFQAAALFECPFCATWVSKKCGCYSSVAHNQVRLLYTT